MADTVYVCALNFRIAPVLCNPICAFHFQNVHIVVSYHNRIRGKRFLKNHLCITEQAEKLMYSLTNILSQFFTSNTRLEILPLLCFGFTWLFVVLSIYNNFGVLFPVWL